MEVTNQASQSASFRHYIHLIVISCVFTLLVLVCWFAIDPVSNFGAYLSSVASSITVATGMLVGVWCVFGAGKLMVRFLLAHAIAAPVIAANAYGHWAAFSSAEYVGVFDNHANLSASIQTSLLASIAIGVAIQVPFWIIRFLGGWRLSIRGNDSASTVPLSELFILTFVFGVAFATPQIADRVIIKSMLDQLKIGGGFEDLERLAPNSWRTSTVSVTADNVEQLRSKVKAEPLYHVSSSIYWFSFLCSVASLLFSPIILITFRVRNWRLAFSYAILYGSGLYLIAMVLRLSNGNSVGVAQLAWELALMVGFIVLGFTIPLLVSRSCGFELHSVKSRKSKMEASKIAEGNVASAFTDCPSV